MKERGYDPVAQLTGYLKEKSEDYITRHGGTREKIKEIPESATLIEGKILNGRYTNKELSDWADRIKG